MDLKQKFCHHSLLWFPFILLVFVPLKCNSKPIIFNFGDSNSDTGNYFITRGGFSEIPQSVIHSLSLPFQGRLCDGRLVLDFICERLNASYLSPFMESFNASFKNGVNFAVGGSAVLPKFGVFSLHIQVQQFGRFQYRSLELTSKGVRGLLGDEDFADALYIIDIGQNDLDQVVLKHYSSYPEIVQSIPLIISEIESVLLNLYVLGARKFWIHGTGPLGCLPSILTSRNYSASDLDRYGCARVANDAARAFNDQLLKLRGHFSRLVNDTDVVYVDIFTIKYDLIANSSRYGFESPLKQCLGDKFKVCDNRSHRVNWDGNHYTEGANKFVADKIFSGPYSTPHVTPAHFFPHLASSGCREQVGSINHTILFLLITIYLCMYSEIFVM